MIEFDIYTLLNYALHFGLIYKLYEVINEVTEKGTSIRLGIEIIWKPLTMTFHMTIDNGTKLVSLNLGLENILFDFSWEEKSRKLQSFC